MKNIKTILLSLGWVLLILSLLTGYVFNTFSENSISLLTPISWDNHKSIFEGAVSCSLTSAALMDRKMEIKKVIFANLKSKKETDKGFIYYFEDDDKLLANIFELVEKEKECCPFFKFDISVLPFEKGIALQVSGSKAAKAFIESFETSI